MTCACSHMHQARRIVLTGGPGAGKTAVLELVRIAMCKHVVVLPESASLVFRGGFPRGSASVVKQAAQRAIYYVQRELEATAAAADPAIVMCDRGTIDGVAYWPGPDDMWSSLGTTSDAELARYHAVVHLRTPALEHGYNHDNPLRIETAEEAAVIDARIARAWASHPRRYEVPATPDFFAKVIRTLSILNGELPQCCRRPDTARELLMASV